MVGLGAALPRAGVGLPVLDGGVLRGLLRGFAGVDVVGVLYGRIGVGEVSAGTCAPSVAS